MTAFLARALQRVTPYECELTARRLVEVAASSGATVSRISGQEHKAGEAGQQLQLYAIGDSGICLSFAHPASTLSAEESAQQFAGVLFCCATEQEIAAHNETLGGEGKGDKGDKGGEGGEGGEGSEVEGGDVNEAGDDSALRRRLVTLTDSKHGGSKQFRFALQWALPDALLFCERALRRPQQEQQQRQPLLIQAREPSVAVAMCAAVLMAYYGEDNQTLVAPGVASSRQVDKNSIKKTLNFVKGFCPPDV